MFSLNKPKPNLVFISSSHEQCNNSDSDYLGYKEGYIWGVNLKLVIYFWSERPDESVSKPYHGVTYALICRHVDEHHDNDQ
jgi:hypothetical protein